MEIGFNIDGHRRRLGLKPTDLSVATSNNAVTVRRLLRSKYFFVFNFAEIIHIPFKALLAEVANDKPIQNVTNLLHAPLVTQIVGDAQ